MTSFVTDFVTQIGDIYGSLFKEYGTILISIVATVFVILLGSIHYFYTSLKKTVIKLPTPKKNESRQRFRKRDKVKFFARKVLRKGKDTANKLQRQVSLMKESVSVPEYSRSGRRLRKRERIMFRGKTEPPKLLRKELPASVLEPDFPDEQSIPEDVMYLLQTVKVFGHFEKGTFLQLCRHMESVTVKKDEYLFKVGDEDHWMYVVQEGQINLFIKEENQETKLSEITSGESLHSLLSILDVLTGHVAPYKTVFAKAVKDSVVIRFPVNVFNDVLEDREDSLVQLVQVIMTRMQRVTFQALHNYLGLSNELLNPVITTTLDTERMSVHKLSTIIAVSEDSSPDAILGKFKSVSDIIDTKPQSAKNHMPKTYSSPLLNSGANCSTSSKQKLLRFETFDTVVDDQDNVFCRQASLPETNDAFMQDLRSTTSVDESLIHLGSEQSVNDVNQRRESKTESIDDDKIVELNEPEILDLVVKDLLSIFGIPESEYQMLSDNVTLLKVPPQHELIEEGEQDGPLYFVVMGALSIYQHIQLPGESEEKEVELFLGTPGMITGQLAMLTGEPSFFAVRSHRSSVIAHIARHSFYKMMRLYPRMVLNTAHTVVQRVSGFVRQIDFALDWMRVEAGKSLYTQGSKSDCMYIVLHGRLRSVMTLPEGKKELVADYGKGELIDMMEALRGKIRPTSLHAVRDTELAKIPEGLVKYIRRIHPSITSHLMSLMSDKLLGNMMSTKPTHPSHMAHLLQHKQHMTEETKFAYGDVSNHLANLTNVAVIPVDQNVPLAKFTMELQHAMSSLTDRTLRLNSDIIKQRLGQNALESAHEYRLCGWLAQQEDLHRIVLYQTDKTLTTWTKRCIRQADALLIVGMGDSDPQLGQLEEEIERMAVGVRALKVLVLLHRPEVVLPTRTVEWLNMRGALTDHLHIKGSRKLFARTRQSKLEEYWEKLKWKSVDRFSDFARLSRFLTGTSIALTLGGGGARGLSQTGIIKALLEAGTPIDYIGGTSMGSFMGALWARHRDLAIVRSKVAVFCGKMSSYAPQVLDLTYPISSMFSGSFFNKAIQTTFKDTQIEDLWIPYYAVTTDVTSSKMRVHTDGMLWRYVRGSMSFTPALPPICDPKDGHLLVDGCYTSNLPGSLWRYVRGSMSLSGYVPPICDPKDGHLLVDGGYINNLPGDIARSRGARRVIAVDVGSATETNFTNYGDSLSGWWLLWKKWTGRWTGRVKIPDMNEIQSRLSYISCHYIMDMVMNSDYCTYIRPPVVKYNTLEFNKHAEIHDVGYHYGKAVFTDDWSNKYWKDILALCNNDLSTAEHNCDDVCIQRKPSNFNFSANTSFMDLAEMLQEQKHIVLRNKENMLSDLSELDEFELDYDSSPEVYQRKMMQMEGRRNNSETDNIYLMGSKSFSDTEAGPSRSSVLLTSDEEDSEDDDENE